jgi:4-hydroxybenzoate polyprenyltransferase
MAGSLLALARPRHWIKNVFVLMPLPFAVASGARLQATPLLLGLLGFCLVNSAVYAFNDVLDVERDRRHPVKRRRPLAAGALPARAALAYSAVLLLAGLALAWAADRPRVLPIVGGYVALNLLYSLGGRQLPLVDVLLLSSGYVLRVLLGCALVGAIASNWLLLCTSTLALFLALAKRRGDLLAGVEDEHRPSLAGYDRRFLEHAMSLTLGMALIAYALYCLDAAVLLPGRVFATLPFAVLAALEYLRQVYVREKGDAPVELVLGSPLLLLCGLGWALSALWSVDLL